MLLSYIGTLTKTVSLPDVVNPQLMKPYSNILAFGEVLELKFTDGTRGKTYDNINKVR